MHLLFLDESRQLEKRKLFALGGVALRDSDWFALREHWHATLACHGWPLEREVKWHGIRTGEVPPALADDLVKAISRAPVTGYVTLLDIELGERDAPAFFTNDEDTYATGLMFLAERFQLRLQADDDLGLIVVDSRFREDDARLRRFFADLTNDGTPYSRLDRIVEGLFLGPSHYSIGLQVADLIVANHGRCRTRQRSGTRLPEDTHSAFRDPPSDWRAGRGRHQALPRDGTSATRRDAPLSA